MNHDEIFRRYQELQQYVGWTDTAASQVVRVAALVEPFLPQLVDDFYAEIDRHPNARKVITGGHAQVERLKGTLLAWLRELFVGCYDANYVVRRWRAGWRHVEIGLDQVYASAALSRLRGGVVRVVQDTWDGDPLELRSTVRSLNMLLDLDLAIIEDAYQTESIARKQRSERLAAIRTLVEAAPCMIVIIRPDGAIHFFSRFAEELTGRVAEEIIGRHYTTFLPAECRGKAAEFFDLAFCGGSASSLETDVVCHDGSRLCMVWNARRLADYEGGPAVLAVGQDITPLKKAQERALQAERLAAIGQMVAGLAHESGNALARSQACLEMLGLELRDRPNALELVARIQKAQDNLQQLYGEVRDYAAPLRLERQTCRLDAIWRAAWANLAMRRQGRDAVLREECAAIDLRCAGDIFRLEQVFRNVLENSLAACRDPVEIRICCSECEHEGRAALQIAVRDNGPGLSAEQRERIFEPFFTTKTKGTGLGMPIARRIVDIHGGRIDLGPGPGAEILITLPRECP